MTDVRNRANNQLFDHPVGAAQQVAQVFVELEIKIGQPQVRQ
jgi:hypothetical protein